MLKKDKFSQARGNYSRLLLILCRKCNATVALYQKDGPGNLRRMYVDRIRQGNKSAKVLKCTGCNELLGLKYVYNKEKRHAYKIFQDALIKKVVSMKKATRVKLH